VLIMRIISMIRTAGFTVRCTGGCSRPPAVPRSASLRMLLPMACMILLFCLSSTNAQDWFRPETDNESAEQEMPDSQQQGDEWLTGEGNEARQGWLEQAQQDQEYRKNQRMSRKEEREARRQRERRSWYIRSVSFTGNESYKAKDLVNIMALKPKSWPNDPVRFTNFMLNSDLAALHSFYMGSGFEYAVVKLNRVERDTASRRVQVYIDITEGQRIRVGEVAVVSDRHEMTPGEMRRLLSKPGSPLIYQNIDQDVRRIKDILGNRGFLAASVTPLIELDSAASMAHVTFDVTEGPKAVACKIELHGNRHVNNEVLTRELTFKSGDTLTSKIIQHSERRLYATSLFNYVQIRPSFDTNRVVTELPDSLYDVQVRVSQTQFFSFQGGGGYSTDEGLRTSASVTYRNMFQLGQGATVSAKLSQVSQGIEGIYVIPWFMYMPLQFDTKLYYTRFDNRELYQGEFNGIRLSLGRQTDYNFIYQVWNQWERVEWVRAPASEDDGPEGVPDYPTQSIGGDIGYDMRNDLFNPTKGGYTSLGLEVAGVFGGNSNRFVKVTFDNRVYFSKRAKYFLSMALRTGYVIPYGESEVVPVQSQFYGGGSTTVRGFPVNKLAVQSNGDPLKGNFYVFANLADFRFPLFWWVNGALFLDAGNVWPEFTDIKSPIGLLDDLRWAIGPGIRVDTPIKLVARLDFGFKIDKRPGESAWELHFDLGQPF